jgi:hypothetical protein
VGDTVLKLSLQERERIAAKRLKNVLERHGVANARTLEQKISDADFPGLRIDPHILTPVRKRLTREGVIVRINQNNVPWYHLTDTPAHVVAKRLADQLPIYNALNAGAVTHRIGQQLEIATFRALSNVDKAVFYGQFRDLDDHDDSRPYSKEEPPQHIGSRQLPKGQRLDFIWHLADVGPVGIECKNVREWLYPNRKEIIETLAKCVTLDCVPVLIGRRVPFVTYLLLSTCGVIVHQTYNQLLPASDQALADQARDKALLGYHDIRTGNQPDDRLVTFISKNVPKIAGEARAKFDDYQDLLFAFGHMSYEEFAARVRRRSQGLNEDADWLAE